MLSRNDAQRPAMTLRATLIIADAVRRLIVVLLATVSWAQQPSAPAPLVWSGKPLQLSALCRTEDLTTLGLACTADEPCAMYLELTAAELVGTRVMVTGNIHGTSATLESVLLTSDDGGRTWTEAHSRLPHSGLDQMQFFDFENGWISGHSLLALPRDPFFLITRDGGKTWHKRPVFSETRVGTIDAFWFDSKTTGMMNLDRLQSAENGMRYEQYESRTGGESWSLRQVAPKATPLKRPPAASALRIRAEARTSVYRVEKRAGESWQTLASFAINAGECKAPEPAPLAEPPPPALEPTPPAAEPKPAKPPSLRRPR
jgi:hypothetical protein